MLVISSKQMVKDPHDLFLPEDQPLKDLTGTWTVFNELNCSRSMDLDSQCPCYSKATG